MSEIPLQAAGLVTFAMFVWKDQRTQWWLGPLALSLPILFRETGVVLGLTMSVMVFSEASNVRILRALACGGLSAIVLLVLLLSPAGAGRPSMWQGNILQKSSSDSLYSDAFAVKEVPRSVEDWTLAIGRKFVSNLRSLVSLKDFLGNWLERFSMLFVLSAVPLGLTMWWRKHDGFALGVVAAVCILLVGDLFFYTVWFYRGIRVLLLMQPFVAVMWGHSLAEWMHTRSQALHCASLTLIVLVGVGAATIALQKQAFMDRWGQLNAGFIESVVGGDRNMVVSPFPLSLDYVNDYYPQEWAFVPSNCATMRLLDARYQIGTVIMPSEKGTPSKNLCGTHLQFVGARLWRDESFWVYTGKEK